MRCRAIHILGMGYDHVHCELPEGHWGDHRWESWDGSKFAIWINVDKAVTMSTIILSENNAEAKEE